MAEPGSDRRGAPGDDTDFRALFQGLPTAYLVIDRDLVIIEANAAYERLVGRSREELVGRLVLEAFPPREETLDHLGRDSLMLSLERVLETGLPDVMPLHEYPVPDPDTGELVLHHWSSVNTPILDASGRARLVVQRVTDVSELVGIGGALDVTDAAHDHAPPDALPLQPGLVSVIEQLRATRDSERAATRALRASERRARAVLDTAVDGILTIDSTGHVQSFNAAAESMFGYLAGEVVGRNISMLMPEPYRSEHDGYLERYHRTGVPRIIGIGREVEGLRKDGSVFPLELAVSEVEDDRILYTGVVRDITERKSLESELLRQARYDPLTGLANRRLLLERIDLALVRRKRVLGGFALLFVDLDRFKLINDTLGHDAGDEVLSRTAQRLRRAVRPEDLVARLGGDEFVVLCEELSERDAVVPLARRIVDQLDAPLDVRGREVHVSASVGVVTDSGGRTATELLADADAAMYQAKSDGGARYTILDDDARRAHGAQLALGGDLHRALEHGELRRHYQPLVDLASGDVLGAEGLMRWQHPRQGELLPGAFLELAHDLGLIVDLDSWMLASACLDAVEWHDQVGRPTSVWVNMSGRSLADPRLLDSLGAVLDHSGLPPRLLTLEITEGALMQNARATSATLDRVRELGVQLAIDDFGTGYSSLSYLQQFQVHALKVDRSFVHRLDAAPEEAEASAAIVQAVVNLASALGLRTVAEGIETREQLGAVRQLGCDLGQGHLLGRPAPQQHLVAAMRTGLSLPAGGGERGVGRRPPGERMQP